MCDDASPDEPAPGQTPRQLTAAPDQAGLRTDRFLADAIGGTSRSRVKVLLLSGHVRRDGVLLRDPAEPVRAGSLYTVDPPRVVAATAAPEKMALAILYEDEDLIVLDKPAGLVVHPAPGNEGGTLVNALLSHCGDRLPGIGGERRPGIVHRLDKDTSGLMVVAKTEEALAALSADFAARRIERSYVALCWGILAPAAGSLDGAIGRDPRDRKRMAVVARGGKAALTHYRTSEVLHSAVSRIECRLATGRTHQIRVHLAHAGHALLGDPVYLRRVPAAAKRLAPESRRAALAFSRQALHAASLVIIHPRDGRRLSFATDPPADFHGLVECINGNSGD